MKLTLDYFSPVPRLSFRLLVLFRTQLGRTRREEQPPRARHAFRGALCALLAAAVVARHEHAQRVHLGLAPEHDGQLLRPCARRVGGGDAPLGRRRRGGTEGTALRVRSPRATQRGGEWRGQPLYLVRVRLRLRVRVRLRLRVRGEEALPVPVDGGVARVELSPCRPAWLG